MATQRAKVHQYLVRYKKAKKNMLRSKDPVPVLGDAFRARLAYELQVAWWKKKKQPRGPLDVCVFYQVLP